jgi:predicted amino acid-binding ACT domain protein
MKQFATITVIGRDKTGVIARVTNFLFEQRANIEALEEQVTRGQFSMTLQASWKRGALKTDSLRAGLATLAKALGMEIKLRLTDPKRRQSRPHGHEGNALL